MWRFYLQNVLFIIFAVKTPYTARKALNFKYMNKENNIDLTVYTRQGKLRKKTKAGKPIFRNQDKPTTMSKPVSIRINLEYYEFAKSQGSLTDYLNKLIKQDYDNSRTK